MGTSVPPPGFAGPSPDQPPPPAAPASRSRAPRNRSKLFAGAGLVVVAVVAALAFLLFGSGGTGVGSPIAQAATLSSSTPGYRMQMSMQLTSSALNGPITVTGSGVVDLRDRAVSMSMVMNFGNEPQVTQALGSPVMRLGMILVGSTAYVKLPPAMMSSLSTTGRPWLKVDIGKLSGVPGLSAFGTGSTATDPGQTLQQLESVSGSVAELGHAQVDGVATTHYQVELSASRLIDMLPSSERSQAQQALSLIQQALPGGEFPVDVWIDSHHLVRRVEMSLDMSIQGQNVQETSIVDIGDYGPQLRPSPPPPSEVLDPSSLAGSLS